MRGALPHIRGTGSARDSERHANRRLRAVDNDTWFYYEGCINYWLRAVKLRNRLRAIEHFKHTLIDEFLNAENWVLDKLTRRR